MNPRRNLIAASLAALPLMLCREALAAGPMMGGPLAAAPPEHAALVAKLAAANDKRGLDQDHGYAVALQHPGVAGTSITRLAHTYKGVRVFQSESVVVTNDAGKIVSESVTDRRAGLGFGAASAQMGGSFSSFNVQPSISPGAAIDMVVAAVRRRSHGARARGQAERRTDRLPDRRPGARRLGRQQDRRRAQRARPGRASHRLRAGLPGADPHDRRGNQPVYYDTIVSANDGHVLKQWKALQTVVGTGNSQYNGTVPISTTLSGSTYTMKDTTPRHRRHLRRHGDHQRQPRHQRRQHLHQHHQHLGRRPAIHRRRQHHQRQRPDRRGERACGA